MYWVGYQKSYAIVILKTQWKKGFNRGDGSLCELMLTLPGQQWVVPGQSDRVTLGEEILYPRVAQFFMQANVWTRYWMFFDGDIGGGAGGPVVQFSAWAADETRTPVLLYDRVPLYTPTAGFDKFRFAYDTSGESTYQVANPLSKSWNRNYIAISGLSLPDVQGLLTQP